MKDMMKDIRTLVDNRQQPLLSAPVDSEEFILAVGREAYFLNEIKEEEIKKYNKEKKEGNAFDIFDDDYPGNWEVDTWKEKNESAAMIYGHIEYAIDKTKKCKIPGLTRYMQETAKQLAEIKSAMLQVINYDDFYALQQLIAAQSKLCHDWILACHDDEP